MKFTNTLLLIALLSLWPQFSTAQALSREEARIQISRALTESKAGLNRDLVTGVQFATIRRSAVKDQDEYHRVVMTYLTTADDGALSSWRTQNQNNALLVDFPDLEFPLAFLRVSWKLGIISRFDISSKIIYPDQSNWPAPLRTENRQTCFYPNLAIPNNYDGSRGGTFLCKLQVDVVGDLKDSAREFCAPQQRRWDDTRQLYCNVTTARREFDRITGITSAFDYGKEIKIVEFDERREPTAAGQFLAVKPEMHPARALFLLYDDGWRVANILD